MNKKVVFPNKKYSVIYADPPWEYRIEVGRGVAKKHYPTMTNKEICSLPVQEISEKDCALILWGTFPKLQEALDVIKAWGFEYKTLFAIWIKTNKRQQLRQKSFLPIDFIDDFCGLGHYTRQNSEFCLIATKGKILKQRKTRSLRSTVLAPIDKHSKKPDQVRKMIEEFFGEQTRIELFAREKKEGWDVWGNEV